MEIFKLNFITSGLGIKTIDEPVGFTDVEFVLKQDGYGRDISFGGDENNFAFYRIRNHCFDELIYEFETFGSEADVQLIIERDSFETILGEINFYTAETDQLEYFKCKVLQDVQKQLIKRREDVKVDLFSDKNLDNEDIEPISTENVLIKAKPITGISLMELNETFTNSQQESGIRGSETWYYNPFQVLKKFEIEDTFIPFSAFDRKNIFRIIKAKNNLKNIKINIKDVIFKETVLDQGLGVDGHVDVELAVWYGFQEDEEVPENKISLFLERVQPDEVKIITGSYDVFIESLPRGGAVYIAFKVRIQKESVIGSITGITEISSGSVNIEATSFSFNTIAPSIRLIDAVRQNLLSINETAVSFPFAEFNGEYYNQRIFNGNLLRGLTDKPFYLTLKEIKDFIKEFNGGVQIQSDNSVFFGLYRDFYTTEECGVFENAVFDDFVKKFNDKYGINEFKYSYKKYQSQKENEVNNTYDSIHGESEWLLANKRVENTKEIKVEFIRDAFSIEELRRKALDLNETTASQDDDTVYIIDTIEAEENLSFSESAFLQHLYDEAVNQLRLNNDGTFSFILLGITTGTVKIENDPNEGTYTILEVSPRYLLLEPLQPISSENNGERNTSFIYTILAETISGGITAGNEGFDYVNGIKSPADYANLKYSVKRNIQRFYNEYLATANTFSKKPIKNTFYKNNPLASLSFDGLQTVEGEDYTPGNPILTPYEYSLTVITDIFGYKELEKNIRDKRGFIRCFDMNGHPIKIYPKEMKFTSLQSKLEIKGEEKFELGIINIVKNIGHYVVNKEYRSEKINYKINDQKVSIFDKYNRLLYKPVFWQKITINEAKPTSLTQLKEWLRLL